MQSRIDICGDPVSLELSETPTGFRLEILPLTDAQLPVTEAIFGRATAWKNWLAEQHPTGSVRCYHGDVRAVVLESPNVLANEDELGQLTASLRSISIAPESARATSAGGGIEGTPAREPVPTG